jgi:hypothetical protein
MVSEEGKKEEKQTNEPKAVEDDIANPSKGGDTAVLAISATSFDPIVI